MSLLALPRRCFLVELFCYFCFGLVFVMPPCLFLVALWSPSGRGWPLGSLVCGVFLCFCCFPMWCPVSSECKSLYNISIFKIVSIQEIFLLDKGAMPWEKKIFSATLSATQKGRCSWVQFFSSSQSWSVSLFNLADYLIHINLFLSWWGERGSKYH